MADIWNEGWNVGYSPGWNEGFNAAKNGQPNKPSQGPGAAPTPTQYKNNPDPWNQGWNQGWNEGWNKGFNEYKTRTTQGSDIPTPPGGNSNPPSQNNSSGGNGSMDSLINAMTSKGHTRESAMAAINGQGYDALAKEYLGAGSGGSSDDALKAWEEKQKSTINSGYDEYEKRLHGLEGDFKKSQDENINATEDTYSKVFNGLDEQKKANLEKLNIGRQGVTERKLTSLDELKKNLADVVRGTSMEMGALGAGDTSAAKVMVPYAYTKIAGDQGATIEKQANQQYFDIDQEERDTDLKFTELWKETEIEKGNKLQEVKNIFGEKLQNISFALASAPLDKEKDLLALQDQILKQAYTKLVNLEAETKQKQDTLKTWATNRLAELNNAKLKLKNTANFSPEDIVFSELKMANSPQVTADNGYNWNPMALAKKVREEFFA